MSKRKSKGVLITLATLGVVTASTMVAAILVKSCGPKEEEIILREIQIKDFWILEDLKDISENPNIEYKIARSESDLYSAKATYFKYEKVTNEAVVKALNKLKKDIDDLEKTINIQKLAIAKKQALEAINKLKEGSKKTELLDKVNSSDATLEKTIQARDEAIAIIKKARDDARVSINKIKGADEYPILIRVLEKENSTENELNEASEEATKIFNNIKNANGFFINFVDNEEFKQRLKNESIKAETYYDYQTLMKKMSMFNELKANNTPNEVLNSYVEKLNNVVLKTPKNIKYVKINEQPEQYSRLDSYGPMSDILRLELEWYLSTLPYPKQGDEPVEAITEMFNKYDELILQLNNKDEVSFDELNSWNSKRNQLRSIKPEKINEYVEAINKLSNPNKESLIKLLNKTNKIVGNSFNSDEEFDNLDAKIAEAKEQEKQDITNKINALENLTDKNSYISRLENKTYDEMLDVYKQARYEDLKAKINELPYPDNNAKAKETLISALPSSYNEMSDELFEENLNKINAIKEALKTTIQKIDSLPYPNYSGSSITKTGKDAIKESLNNKATAEEITASVPDHLSEYLTKWNELISDAHDNWGLEGNNYDDVITKEILVSNNDQTINDMNEALFNNVKLAVFDQKMTKNNFSNLTDEEIEKFKEGINTPDFSNTSETNNMVKLMLDRLKEAKKLNDQKSNALPDRTWEETVRIVSRLNPSEFKSKSLHTLAIVGLDPNTRNNIYYTSERKLKDTKDRAIEKINQISDEQKKQELLNSIEGEEVTEAQYIEALNEANKHLQS
ncbi:hypothetical protein AB5V95_02880 [Metamycoplasma spumans]|uniref:hypothetical protein n=1 Tax=Metamycoplasma spumans TaxID=92406 RepID=UPI0034DD7A11